jgi:hypothetical protein
MQRARTRREAKCGGVHEGAADQTHTTRHPIRFRVLWARYEPETTTAPFSNLRFRFSILFAEFT